MSVITSNQSQIKLYSPNTNCHLICRVNLDQKLNFYWVETLEQILAVCGQPSAPTGWVERTRKRERECDKDGGRDGGTCDVGHVGLPIPCGTIFCDLIFL